MVSQSPTTESTSGQRVLATITHLLGISLGVIGAGIVYLFAPSEFISENAKNALNWQLLIFASVIVAVAVAFGLGIISDWFVIIAALTGVVTLGINLVACLIAAVNAARGKAWKYPFAPNVV